jgi:hypothetical protein
MSGGGETRDRPIIGAFSSHGDEIPPMIGPRGAGGAK